MYLEKKNQSAVLLHRCLRLSEVPWFASQTFNERWHCRTAIERNDWNTTWISYFVYHRFRWYATLKTKHPWKRFQHFRQFCVLLTDRVEIHQLQPQVWPSNLLYVMLSCCDWWIDFHLICLTSFSTARSAEENTSWKVFCLTSSKSCRDTQVIPSAFASSIWSWIILVNGQITKTQAFALFSSSFATTIFCQKIGRLNFFHILWEVRQECLDFKANFSLM